MTAPQPVPGFRRLAEENAFAVLARAGELAASGRSIVNLGIGQPDFPTPEHIVEAAVRALRDGEHGYTPALGLPALREAVADELDKRYRAAVDPERVVIVPGGKVTMFSAILMLGAPGAEILYPDPGFPIYRSMIEYTGATAVPVPIRAANAFALSADDVLSRITAHTRLLILNSPANPCGGVTPRHEIDALVAGLDAAPQVAILSDEIYDRMLYDDRPHVSLLEYPSIRDRLILLNGWSKTYAMTGWRLGYGVWPASLIAAVRKLAVNAWSCVNAPAQHAALAALTGPQTSVDTMMSAFDRRRQLLVDGLNAIDGVRVHRPAGAFYAFPDISGSGWRSRPLASALLEQAGVATIGGADFGHEGEGYLRLSYANSRANIREALDRIARFLGDHPEGPPTDA